MQVDSTPVTSTQRHLHKGLGTLVRRHLESRCRRPVAQHSALAFEQLQEALARLRRPLVLDSFCGTGHSTAALALRHPDHLVVGIDKSLARLSRHRGGESGNYLLLRAPCEDLWKLLLGVGLAPDYHYLFYPNPWPKPGHLQRRVHGSAALRSLLELGGRVELRSNWRIYVEEFGVALHLAGARGIVQRYEPGEPITLFERKYLASGHTLWRCVASVPRD